MSKVTDWLRERGFRIKNIPSSGGIEILKLYTNKKVCKISGSELSQNPTYEKIIALLEQKLK